MSRALDTAKSQQSNSGPTPPFVAGKNKIINGDFSINQRAFSSVTANLTFTFDRWKTDISGTTTCTPQSFTPGAAPVAGYEGANYLQIVTSGHTGTNGAGVYHRIEDVRTLAGQTATVSFWAKASSGTPSILVNLGQLFGSGGSSTVVVSPSTPSTATAITTSWARYSFVFNVPSLSGKTIGTSNSLQVEIGVSDGGFLGLVPSLGVQNNTFSIWGVQIELGSIATPFTTATGTLQGELAACQRYFQRIGNNAGAYYMYTCAAVEGVSTLWGAVPLPVTMRVVPSMSATSSGNTFTFLGYGNVAASFIYLDTAQSSQSSICMGSNTISGLTANQSRYIRNLNDSSGTYISLSAEL